MQLEAMTLGFRWFRRMQPSDYGARRPVYMSGIRIRILVTFVKWTGSVYLTKHYLAHQFVWDSKAAYFTNVMRIQIVQQGAQ